MATNPPCFAFVNYKHREDAEEAIRAMDGKYVNSKKRKQIFRNQLLDRLIIPVWEYPTHENEQLVVVVVEAEAVAIGIREIEIRRDIDVVIRHDHRTIGKFSIRNFCEKIGVFCLVMIVDDVTHDRDREAQFNVTNAIIVNVRDQLRQGEFKPTIESKNTSSICFQTSS